MGSSLHRIEVLLIGLVLLIAAAIVVGLTLLRPASPTAYVQATPQPVLTSVITLLTSAPLPAPTLAAALIPTAAPVATAVPAATSAPIATAASIATMAPPAIAVSPTTSGPLLPLAVPPVVKIIWPWLLLVVGLGSGALVLLSSRKRRMPYTSQSVGSSWRRLTI